MHHTNTHVHSEICFFVPHEINNKCACLPVVAESELMAEYSPCALVFAERARLGTRGPNRSNFTREKQRARRTERDPRGTSGRSEREGEWVG